MALEQCHFAAEPLDSFEEISTRSHTVFSSHLIKVNNPLPQHTILQPSREGQERGHRICSNARLGILRGEQQRGQRQQADHRICLCGRRPSWPIRESSSSSCQWSKLIDSSNSIEERSEEQREQVACGKSVAISIRRETAAAAASARICYSRYFPA